MADPASLTPEQLEKLLGALTEEERTELDTLLAADIKDTFWRPLPGPQTAAFYSKADIIGYGGAAGAGKSDLILGKTLMAAHTARIMRREGTQLVGLTERLAQMLGDRSGWNGQSKIWRDAGPRKVTIEFGATPNIGDEQKYQGRPADFLAFDEAPGFLEAQVRFLLGWNRTTIPGVSPQTLFTFNPPTSTQGRWIIKFFAPWLDREARRKAEPGELVYVATVPQPNGTSADEFFVPPKPFVLRGREKVYDFDPADYRPEDVITPSTRTFIPGRISNNPYLLGTGYLRQLQSLKEPLRSQLLHGDFSACMKEDANQVIPTAWVDLAMERWRDRAQKGEMQSVGVDVARGGDDFTTIAKLHEGNWIDRLVKLPGTETPDGPTTAGLILANVRSSAPVHIDAIGVGASPFDFLRGLYGPTYGINVSHKATARDRSGIMLFKNLRSQLWWQAREALDPSNGEGVALPPDEDLKEQLCAATYDAEGNTVQVSSTDEIKEIIGRSPDDATAVILALIRTPKRSSLDNSEGTTATQGKTPYDPYAGVHT